MTSLKQLSMRGARTLSVVLLLTLLTAVASSAAPLWHHVTVISAEGWRYDDVTVYLSDDVEKLVIRHSDSSRTILEFKQISSVRNLKGEDITRYVYDPAVTDVEEYNPLPLSPPPPVINEDDKDQVGRRPLPLPVEGRRFSGAFSLQGAYNFATGNFFGNRKGGFALCAAYRKRTRARPYWGVMYIYQRIDSREGGSVSYSPYHSYSLSAKDYGQHEFYANIGFHSRPTTYGSSFFLWELGVGLMTFSESDQYGNRMSEATTIALRLAAIYAKPLGRNTSLMFEVNSRVSRQGSDGRGDVGVLFGAGIGLMFMGGS